MSHGTQQILTCQIGTHSWSRINAILRILLAKAYPLEINIKAKETYTDRFIDDIITITVAKKNWTERAKIAAILVIYILFHPLQSSETTKCDNPLSLRNISREWKLDEGKTCLGWDINTHSLRVFIPK